MTTFLISLLCLAATLIAFVIAAFFLLAALPDKYEKEEFDNASLSGLDDPIAESGHRAVDVFNLLVLVGLALAGVMNWFPSGVF